MSVQAEFARRCRIDHERRTLACEHFDAKRAISDIPAQDFVVSVCRAAAVTQRLRTRIGNQASEEAHAFPQDNLSENYSWKRRRSGPC
jgi:hypothetical protein